MNATPKKPIRVSFEVTAEEYEALKALADAEDRTVNKQATRIFRRGNEAMAADRGPRPAVPDQPSS